MLLIGFEADQVAIDPAEVSSVRGLDPTAVDPRTGQVPAHLVGKATEVVMRNREVHYLTLGWAEVVAHLVTAR